MTPWNPKDRMILMTSQNQFYLQEEAGVLQLRKKDSSEKIYVDFLDGKFQFRLKTLSKNQPLFKAVGLQKDIKILDATAGLGKDALSFAYLGAYVVAIEENQLIFALLENGLQRAFEDAKFKNKFQDKIQIHQGSSLDFMKNLSEAEKPDVIYLDPMYPEAEKSAKPKKEMVFLRELLKPTENLEQLVELALQKTKGRVVLKRPLDSDFILKKPQHSFQSKMVRFDMYLV
jgi:16S rRNA (guanine1516-N2)-methyltransferase